MMDLIASKGNNIYASPKLIRMPEFQHILKQYGIDTFGQFIIFMYYVYKTYSKSGNDDDVSYMSELSISERIERTFQYHVDSKYEKLFTSNEDFENAIKIYMSIEMTKVEQMYYNVKKDIDDFLEKLSAIPFEKEVYINVDTPDEYVKKGYQPKTKIKVSISNMDEKMKAIKTSNDLISYLKKMEDVAMAERMKFIKKAGRNIKQFEDPEAIKEFDFVLYNEEIFEPPKGNAK